MRKKRIWFTTLAERKAWEEKQQQLMNQAISNYSGPVTKLESVPLRPEYGDKTWTVKSKNYKRNGNLK